MPLYRNDTSAGSVSPAPMRDTPSRNGVRTQIPVPMYARRLSTETPPPSPISPNEKWKTKYDDCENKRKILVAHCQRVEREKEDYQNKFMVISQQYEKSVRHLQEKEDDINQLKKLAEAMFKEYDQLKNRYDLDTGALQEAIQRASKWYKQNRELKRKSTALVQKVLQVAPEVMNGMEDVTDHGTGSDQDEVENLQKSIKDLNKEIARLQSELNGAKLQEFEAQEQAMELQSSLEEEQNKTARLQSEVDELKVSKTNLVQITRLIAHEVSSLREQCEKEKDNALKLKQDADEAKRERNILAHQSQLLMVDASSNEKLINALLEIENMTRILEEEKLRHEAEILKLQEKMEDQDSTDTEALTERLKIIESELDCAVKRAERSETHNQELLEKVKHLETELEKKSAPPPPPLPPPPPPMPSSMNPSRSNQQVTVLKRVQTINENQSSAVADMANILGIKRSAQPTLQPGAIDDIINQIKGGRFTLKTPEKQKVKVEEQPPAVKEIMNVLGTLRRRPRRTPSFKNMQTELKPATADITI